VNYRVFGRTGWNVSEVGFGAWAIGGSWGTVSEEDAVAALHAAIDDGVNFVDTADVYGDGRSEQIVGRVVKERPEEIHVATKLGRRLSPHVAEGYTPEAMEGFIDRSLKNLNVDTLDLVQLHCPPTQVYYQPEVFDALERFVAKGKIRHYGVSVEKVEEAIKATEYPGVKSVQIIFNMFRQRPAELFFQLATEREVAILTRVPLASGLLTGKMTRDSRFPKDDHRNFNIDGSAFDRGETFAGVDFETGLEAVERLRQLVPEGVSMAQFALRWILSFPAVSAAIPGAKNPEQAHSNAGASSLPALSKDTMDRIGRIYDEFIRPQVHQRW
jgi:aryl-alcohol dehydrogenase-like predicted oxidoreductase